MLRRDQRTGGEELAPNLAGGDEEEGGGLRGGGGGVALHLDQGGTEDDGPKERRGRVEMLSERRMYREKRGKKESKEGG